MMLYSVCAGEFKLDGGAMFGVVPKTIWNKQGLADEANLVSLAMRCLLIEVGERLILIDTGIGHKLSAELAPYYHINSDISLEQSLRQQGFSTHQITDVILSHLHLDHAGGAISMTADGTYYSTFPKATYWSCNKQWAWATENPNPREKASFRPENLLPLSKSGQLKMIDDHPSAFPKELSVLFADGHTQGMMLPIIQYKDTSILFAADLLPSIYHIPIPYIPAYDISPLTSMEEKKRILEQCVERQYIIFLDHDPVHECCTLRRGTKNIELLDTFPLSSCL